MLKFLPALLVVTVKGTPHPAVETQSLLDASRPDLGPRLTDDSDSEVILVASTGAEYPITLRRMLQQIPDDSVSFSLHEWPTLVITYYPEEAAMSNLKISKMLGGEISPDIQYVSPPSLNRACPKTNFVSNGRNVDKIRFIIRERFGNFLSEISSVPRRFAGLANAARLLKRLHTEFKIFHGDIGPHSVLIDKTGQARLIHFQFTGTIAHDAPASSGKSIYPLRGAADDFFKLLFSMVNFPASEEEEEEEYWVWAKQDVDVFLPLIESLELRARVKHLITSSVHRLLHCVRNIESDADIPYDEIISDFESLAALTDIENHIYWPTLKSRQPESVGQDAATLVELFQDDASDDPTESFDYELNLALLAKLVNPDSQLFEFLQFSQYLDQDKSIPVPKLFHKHELITNDADDDEPYLRIELGEVLSEGALSTVHHLASHPNWVVKYQSNCDAHLNQVHPLIMEFNFLKKFEGLGVTPKVIYLSRPAGLARPMYVTTKTSFVNKPHFVKACRNRLDMHVRFMVMEKVFMTFHDLEQEFVSRHQYVPMSLAIVLMHASVEALEMIHAERIVHGDVHAGNLAILDGVTHSVGLIDFGRSKSVSDDLYYLTGGDRIAHPLTNVNVMFSPFEIEGFKSSFRDDIYRALEIGVNYVSGGKLYTYMDSLIDSNNPQLLYEYKARGDLLRIPVDSDDPSAIDRIDMRFGLTEAEKHEMRNALRKAISVVRRIPNIYRRPDYAQIKECLKLAHDLAVKAETLKAAASATIDV